MVNNIGIGQLSLSKNIKKITPCYFYTKVFYKNYEEIKLNERITFPQTVFVMTGRPTLYKCYYIKMPENINEVEEKAPLDVIDNESVNIYSWSFSPIKNLKINDEIVKIANYCNQLNYDEIYGTLYIMGLCEIKEVKLNGNIVGHEYVLNEAISENNLIKIELFFKDYFNKTFSQFPKTLINKLISSQILKTPDIIKFFEDEKFPNFIELLESLDYSDAPSDLEKKDFPSFEKYIQENKNKKNEEDWTEDDFKRFTLKDVQLECNYIEYYEEGLNKFSSVDEDNASDVLLNCVSNLNELSTNYENSFWRSDDKQRMFFGNKEQYLKEQSTALRLDEDSYDIVKHETIDGEGKDSILASYAIGTVLFGSEFQIEYNKNGFSIFPQTVVEGGYEYGGNY